MITLPFVGLNVGKQNDCDCCKGKETSARSGRSRYPGQRSMTAAARSLAAERYACRQKIRKLFASYRVQNKNNLHSA